MLTPCVGLQGQALVVSGGVNRHHVLQTSGCKSSIVTSAGATVKPLSHQLATSGDALATNNFGHIANASPDIVSTLPLHRQWSSAVVKLGDFFGMFKKIAKRRQPSPVNIASSSGCQRFANHRQAIPAARQCVVNRSSVFLDLQR